MVDALSVSRPRVRRVALGLTVWAIAWTVMLWLDPWTELPNLALLLVLAAAVSGLWLPVSASVPACALSALAFNWAFVPPRGTLSVDLRSHAWLLGAMLVVAWIVSLLVARQRALADAARQAEARVGQLRNLGDLLRDADDPLACALSLTTALAQGAGPSPVRLLMLREPLPVRDDERAAAWFGDPDGDARAGLWLCTRQAAALGPGTGRHDDQPCWYLPLRGRGAAYGAAQVEPGGDPAHASGQRQHAQALCDQMGLALERAHALAAALRARDEARAQELRSTLLAAIAHDHRTPLATIVGAASMLAEPDSRLAPEQRQRLAESIVDEAARLARLTDNTLGLARLDGPGVQLSLDWESAEEMVGSAAARVRRSDPQRRLRTRVEPGLPLLRCDAVLVVQMLVNLLDNALKYSPSDAPVEVVARRDGEAKLLLAVRDRGPGVAPAMRERIFEVFRRGDPALSSHRQGVGIGLALARAVARVHGGTLVVRPRAHGGSAFECRLPLSVPPTGPADEASP